MDNYLNEVTSKSITKFSIDTAQQALEFLKRIHDGKNVNYESFSNEDHDEPQPPEIVDDIPSKQQMVINALKKENIPIKIIDDDFILEETDTYYVYKYGIIFTNADNFVRMIKTKMESNKDILCPYLREHFIQKEGKDYKLYYYLRMNKNHSNKDNIIKINSVSTDINKAIAHQVYDCYPDLEIDQQIALSNMYVKKMFRFNLKLDDVLNTIKEKAKEYYSNKNKEV